MCRAGIKRSAVVLVHGEPAGVLEELAEGGYRFRYLSGYEGPPVSLTITRDRSLWEFKSFPAFFEGLLPEGSMLKGLLQQYKLDENDLFSQLVKVGGDLSGAVTVEGST